MGRKFNQNRNAADNVKEAIKGLTDKERLLLLFMLADFLKGKIYYKDAPKRLKDIFVDMFPVTAKYIDE